MASLGHILLLGAFVASGFAATALIGADRLTPRGRRRQWLAAAASFVLLTLACLVLGQALIAKDFRFAYVAQYVDQTLPWQYALSALWVGQAGSLLLWCWLSAAVALVFSILARRVAPAVSTRAFGLQMAMVCALAAIMIFAADPMRPSTSAVPNGLGLNPVLQHPVMLVHPPVVFLGYALWMVPFSLILATLLGGQIDGLWIREARRWALCAWGLLGTGIVLGGKWAYEELGWGGYWAWDPVENGSLIPWLTGTAFIHTMMSWQYRGVFKKTCLGTGIATFALCLFASFLTRSGLFSSLHAFSQSPIGWLFLVLMGLVAAGGGALMLRHRRQLHPDRTIESIASRESLVIIALVALLLLTAATIGGTLFTPLSGLLLSNRVAVGAEFYNRVVIPVGLVLAVTTPLAPLLRWGRPPNRSQARVLGLMLASVLAGLVASFLLTDLDPLELIVLAFGACSVAALLAHLAIESARRSDGSWPGRVLRAMVANRRQYSGFVIHCGFMMAAAGIAGSSLATLRHDGDLAEGQRLDFAGYSIEYAGVRETEHPGKLAVEAELQIVSEDGSRFTLRPAQHYHHHHDEWTTEVAIHSTWARDFYAIVYAGQAGGEASFSFLVNPMMKWLWRSGWVVGLGMVLAFLPPPRRSVDRGTPPRPKHKRRGKRSTRRKQTMEA